MEAFWLLGPPARCPFSPTFFGEGSPTKIDHRKKGALILTSEIWRTEAFWLVSW